MNVSTVVASADMVDEYGHVNYQRFPELFEWGQDALMADFGTSFKNIEEVWGLRSFVRVMNLSYREQLRAGEPVDVMTFLTLGETSLRFEQFMRDSAGNIVAELKLVVVTVSLDGQPCPPPSDLRAILSK